MGDVNNDKYKNYLFDVEKLEVYKLALIFIKKAFKINKNLGREYWYSIGDQFTRAALSIANNIAEGSGKDSKKAKLQFYNYSLNSARECIPMITLLYEEKVILKDLLEELRSECVYICNMLGKLTKNLK